jgi:hypothetical protein
MARRSKDTSTGAHAFDQKVWNCSSIPLTNYSKSGTHNPVEISLIFRGTVLLASSSGRFQDQEVSDIY